jgi:hypothetical protein
MIVVTAHLVSAKGHYEELGRMYIVNDGTGTLTHGAYNAAICRKGHPEIPSPLSPNQDAPKATRVATLKNWPRQAKTIWQMVGTILDKMYGKQGQEIE